MLQEVTLGDNRDKNGLTQVERRSVIGWCQRFAKTGPWRDIRKQCWCKMVNGPTPGELKVQVAIRHELFSQLNADKTLRDMTAREFAKYAELYGVAHAAKKHERAHGNSCLILNDDFVADLLETVPPEPEGDLVGGTEIHTHATEASVRASKPKNHISTTPRGGGGCAAERLSESLVGGFGSAMLEHADQKTAAFATGEL